MSATSAAARSSSDSPSSVAIALDGTEAPQDLTGNVLIIGVGRVGQVVSQHVLARGARISIIDHEPKVARDAERLDLQRVSGIHAGRSKRLGNLEQGHR